MHDVMNVEMLSQPPHPNAKTLMYNHIGIIINFISTQVEKYHDILQGFYLLQILKMDRYMAMRVLYHFISSSF